MNLLGVSLGNGNDKLGEVFSFSLPSKITCPGMSKWCKKNCYAYKYERRRPGCRKAYLNNLKLAQDIQNFKRVMIGVLPRIIPCFRIHVSGDFFISIEYINAWIEICSAFPQIKFWSYTRSWIVPELLPSLEELKSLPNMQLFASTDPFMPIPPKDWRIAFIDTDKRAQGMKCKTRQGKTKSCLSCGYCFHETKGHVQFLIH